MRGTLALALLLVAACGGERRGGEANPPSASDTAVPPPASAAKSPAADPAATATPAACPATGLWSRCAIIERLDRAGLAPRVDSAPAAEPPLAPAGILVRVGNSELELYIYEDASARERDEAKLNMEKYLEYPKPLTMRAQATLIKSVNLIAILNSRSEHQRERVSDAITAGPPQPPK